MRDFNELDAQRMFSELGYKPYGQENRVKYSNSGRGLCWSGFWVSSVRSGAWFGVEVDLTREIGFRWGLTYVV